MTLKALGAEQGVYQADFLVDTEATDSLAPATELRRIGVKPEGKMVYKMACGTLQEHPFGLARLEFMGEVTAGSSSVQMMPSQYLVRQRSNPSASLLTLPREPLGACRQFP